MRITPALIALLSVCCLAAGCGSSSKSSSSASASTSTSGAVATPDVATWRTQLNTMCRDANARASRIPRPTNASQVQSFLQSSLNMGRQLVDKIRAVQAPAAVRNTQRRLADELTKIYDAYQRLVDRHLAPSQLTQEIRGSFASSIQGTAKDYVTRARRAGLTSCTISGG